MATEFLKPEYPQILTEKDWDKNKGVIAKMHGSTGLGEKMSEVEALFEKVEWKKLNLHGRWLNWGEVTVDAWDKVCNEAKHELNGSLARVSKALYELRDLAKEVQAEFKKSKTIPSSSTKHVAEIAMVADHFGVSLNKNTVGAILEKMHDEYLEHIEKNFLEIFPSGLKKVIAKHAHTLDEVKADPTPSHFQGLACQKMARDYTTGLGNIAKAHDKGFKIKNGPAAGVLFERLSDFANLKVHPKDNEEVKVQLDKLEKICTAVVVFAKAL